MASRPLQADRASVTIPPSLSRFTWPAGLPATADFLPAQQLFAMLGHDGAGELIEALLDVMDSFDGDPDLEMDIGDLEDGDIDCCSAGDDDVQHGPCMFGRGDGLPGDLGDAEDGHDAEQLATMSGGGSDAA